MIRLLCGALAALLLTLSAAKAAPTHVQSAQCFPGAAGPTFSCTFGAPVQGGDAVLVGFTNDTSGAATAVASCTDDQSDPFTVTDQVNDPQYVQNAGTAFGVGLTAGAQTVTCTLNGNASCCLTLTIEEYSGVATAASALDSHNIRLQASTTTPASPTITTSANGELIWSYLQATFCSSNPTISVGGGFTLRADNQGVADADAVQAAASAIAVGFSSSVSCNYVTAVIALKAAAPGGGSGGSGGSVAGHVQSAACSPAAAGTTFSCSFSAPILGGDAVLVAITHDSSGAATAITACTDDKADPFTLTEQVNDPQFAQNNGGAFGLAITAGALTVTCTLNGNASCCLGLVMEEYSGVATAASDGHNIQLQAATQTPTSPSITTAANGDLIWGFTQSTGCGSSSITAAGAGFTLRNANQAMAQSDADKIQVAAGAAAISFEAGAACNYATGVIALKTSTGGGSGGGGVAPSSETRTSSFAYDPATGLLTQEVVEPNLLAFRLETDYTRDAFGNKLAATVSGNDIATRSTQNTYDANAQFVTSGTNALGQSETWQYDARFGLPTSHTGPNGLTTTWTYDAFGRKTLETRADGTQTTFAYVFCSGFNGGAASCVAGAVYLVRSTPLAADGATQNGPQSVSYFDQLNRAIASDSQGFDASITRVTSQYDSLGRVQQTSRPFFASGGTPVFTVPSYDALNRVIKTTFPDGSTAQIAYHALSVTATNALGQARTVVKNDQGLVASVIDALGAVTKYVYDPFGNLAETTDPAGNITTASYDQRGRKVAMSDPDMGAWSYAFDTASELTSQTNANGQTTTFQYDLLGRLTQRVEPDMTCAWVYDTATMGIGKLASASVTSGPSNGYQRSYTYDSLGRPSQVAFVVDGASSFTIATTYDGNGHLSTAQYPSGFTAQYAYTALGYQSQVSDAASENVFWTANARDAELHLTQQTAGNGVATTQSFDPQTGRLTAIQAGNAAAVADFTYVYDALGNLSSRSDANFSLAESFQYDGLNRLTSSTITGSPSNPAAKSFAYDALGNITAKSDVGNYTYPPPGGPQPHAVTSVGGGVVSATFTYDPIGNETAGLNGRSSAYASYNMPTSVTLGTANLAFTYDTEHQRLKKLDTNGSSVVTTLYLSAGPVYAERVTGAGGTVTWNEYLSAGDGLIAVRFNDVTDNTLTTRYLHKDHLGSVAVLTDESGNVVQRLAYDPWGKQRDPATWADDPAGNLPSQDQTTRGFAGQEQLADVGLVDMNARLYDPVLGRFTSADSVVQDPYDAQSLNRYSYVYDNPLAYTDPSGHCFLGLCHIFSAIASILSAPIHAAEAIFNGVASFIRHNPIVAQIVGAIAVAVSAVLCQECAIGVAFAVNAFNTGVTSGKIGLALEAGAISAAEAAAFDEVGNLTPGASDFGSAAFFENVAGHAAVGCAFGAAAGGSCGSGAISAGAGAFAAPLIQEEFPNPQNDFGNLVGGTMTEAAVGGLASVAGGGKFANGAVTAAFGYLFNSELHVGVGGELGDLSGEHDYTTTNAVCPGAWSCSEQEIQDQVSRFGVPGQDGSTLIESGQTSMVYDPRTGMPGGYVVTDVSSDGLTVTNTTTDLHLLAFGQVNRTAWQASDGTWYVTTHGTGNNVIPGMNVINQWQGPKVFDALDAQMRTNIGVHHF
jgi:RHS repeat-associated protein